MKNKIIAGLIFIVPLAIYAAISHFGGNVQNEAVAADGRPTVYIFSSPMCGECKRFAPVADEVKELYKDKIDVIKINATNSDASVQEKVKKYNVYLVPTSVFTDKNGHEVSRAEGAISKEEFCQKADKLL